MAEILIQKFTINCTDFDKQVKNEFLLVSGSW